MSRREESNPFDPFRSGLSQPENYSEIRYLISLRENFTDKPLGGSIDDEDLHRTKEINSINSIDTNQPFPENDKREDYDIISWENPYEHKSHHGDLGQDMTNLGNDQERQVQVMRNRRLLASQYGSGIVVKAPLQDETATQPRLTLDDVRQATEMLARMDVEKTWLRPVVDDSFHVVAGRLAISNATVHPLYVDTSQISSRNIGFIRGLEDLVSDQDNPFANPDKDGNVRLVFEKDLDDTTTEQQIKDMLAYLVTRPTKPTQPTHPSQD